MSHMIDFVPIDCIEHNHLSLNDRLSMVEKVSYLFEKIQYRINSRRLSRELMMAMYNHCNLTNQREKEGENKRRMRDNLIRRKTITN